jgi:hypothetical protein
MKFNGWMKLAMVAGLCFLPARVTRAGAADGEDMMVHNNTGHTVVAFLFTDDRPHMNEKGGVQFGVLHDGESAVAHVPTCRFAVLLVDHDNIWHAEFHDCHSTDMVFTSNTGAGHRQ